MRRFGTIEALARTTLTIRRGEFFSLLGPSGCGKTTLLADHRWSWILPDAGVVRIGGIDMRSVPAHKRPVNTVFQSYALFPHLNVYDNVAFGLRMKKLARVEIGRRVRQVMEGLVNIAALAERRPAQLSGGQQQRVALARAIVNEPQVLLLDEPLGALDLQLRKQLQVELLALQRRLGITFVYVTHDQEEALVMSDRIAVMRQGKIEQMGASGSVVRTPPHTLCQPVSRRLQLYLSATVLRRAPSQAMVSTSLGTLRVVLAHNRQWQRNARRLRWPSDRRRCAWLQPTTHRMTIAATVRVQQLIYSGATTHYVLRAGAQELLSYAINATAGSPGLAVGQEVVAYLPPAELLVLDD